MEKRKMYKKMPQLSDIINGHAYCIGITMNERKKQLRKHFAEETT